MLSHIPMFICTILLFITTIGIYRSKNTLQTLHFVTIIEIICIPLALITILTTIDILHTRVLYIIFIASVLSPISSYFIGKKYYYDNVKNR